MSDLEIRSIELRSDAENGTVEGYAIRYDDTANIGGRYSERVERGAIQDSGAIKFFWNHSEPIGRVIESEDRDDGFWIKARVSDTAAGRDALTLLRDGVIDKFSIGFAPVEHREDEDGVLVRTAIDLREVSAVPFPAYANASVSQVRAADSATPDALKEATLVTDTATNPDLSEVRETIEDLERRMSAFTAAPRDEEVVEHRSAGTLLRAAVKGDDSALASLNDVQERAYTGGVLADGGSTLKKGWVGDLTRFVESNSSLRGLFATGTLPDEGNYIEYAELASNSVVVGKQAAEGDPLPYGKITLTTKTAPVSTFGGYIQLSRQAIERSSINILDASFRAQAIATGKAVNNSFRTVFTETYSTQLAAGNKVGISQLDAPVEEWLEAVVDAAVRFDAEGLSMDALVVTADIYKALLTLTDAEGRPVFLVTGNGTNNVGTADLIGLSGNLAGLRVVLDPGQPLAAVAAFVNRNAIRSYVSPVTRLQDTNVINLTEDFSLYYYAAFAAEIPAGVVALEIEA